MVLFQRNVSRFVGALVEPNEGGGLVLEVDNYDYPNK